MEHDKSVVLIGRIGPAYGIKGWVKVTSYTDPAENLFDYTPWRLCRDVQTDRLADAELLDAKPHGKGFVALLKNVNDRDQAEQLAGMNVYVLRDQLPEPEDGLYYWTDLEGMQVETLSGEVLGRVDHMLEAGAADVMVVCGEMPGASRHLIPFIRNEVILNVDLEQRRIQVDWNDEGLIRSSG
jgi:16S rRNA processing protein RimM